MGCAASNIDMGSESKLPPALGPIRRKIEEVKKRRHRRRSRRYSSVSTTELLQHESEESDITGDTGSSSDKVKTTAVAPEPIQEETDEVENEEYERRERLKVKSEEPKENIEEPMEKNKETKKNNQNSEEPKVWIQKIEGAQGNGDEKKEQNKYHKEEKSEEPKEKSEEPTVRNQASEEQKEKSDESQEKNEEHKEKSEQPKVICLKSEVPKEKSEQPKVICLKIEEPKEKSEQPKVICLKIVEPKEKSEEERKKEEENDGAKLTVKTRRNGLEDEYMAGSPSFRFYCTEATHTNPPFDPEEATKLPVCRRPVIDQKQLDAAKVPKNEPIEEVAESLSSEGSACGSVTKREKSRKLFRNLTKTPSAVRGLFTCYSNNNNNVNSPRTGTNLDRPRILSTKNS